jgi:hypothetical protein
MSVLHRFVFGLDLHCVQVNVCHWHMESQNVAHVTGGGTTTTTTTTT